MIKYTYKAADKNGMVLTGILEGDNESDIVAELDRLGYIPIRISPIAENGSKKWGSCQSAVGRGGLLSLFVSRISSDDILFFTQDLAALLKAGLPLDRSLQILISACGSDAFRRIIDDILLSVEKGQYLSDALAEHPGVFTVFYVSMVRAGEVGGVLDDVLERMGAFLETIRELKEYVFSAMLYPAFLAGVGGVSIVLLLTFVIPRFSMIFETMDRQLPLSAQLLLSFSGGLKSWWWLIGMVCTGIGYGCWLYVKTEKGRYQVDALLLRLPLSGEFVRKMEVARFSRTLGTLVHSGVPILQALKLVRDILTNRVVASSLDNVYDQVKEGTKLAAPLEKVGIFPPLAIQMIMVGEETGHLDTMLLRVADNYEKTVRNQIKKFVNMLEPVMILVMGLVIGFIVITMLMAIFSMNDLPF